MAFLAESCSIKVLTRDLLVSCKTFHCGDKDLDDFFLEDAALHHNALLGKSYCFTLDEDPRIIVCAFTLANDSVHVDTIPNAHKKRVNANISHSKQMRRYPAILIGRLAVNKDFADKGIGSELLSILKMLAIHQGNLSDCRFLAVDAKNEPKSLFTTTRKTILSIYIPAKSKKPAT